MNCYRFEYFIKISRIQTGFIYRIITVYSLAAILLGVSVGKEVHVMLHNHQHGVACDASGSDRHFHENETPVHDCHLCQITCPTFDDTINIFKFKDKEIANLVVSFEYLTSYGIHQTFAPPLRGPPSIT